MSEREKMLLEALEDYESEHASRTNSGACDCFRCKKARTAMLAARDKEETP